MRLGELPLVKKIPAGQVSLPIIFFHRNISGPLTWVGLGHVMAGMCVPVAVGEVICARRGKAFVPQSVYIRGERDKVDSLRRNWGLPGQFIDHNVNVVKLPKTGLAVHAQ